MLRKVLAVIALFAALAASPARAEAPGALFINLTTDEPHRADMAMMFAGSMLQRGHAVTLWLNDRAVLLAAKIQAGTFAKQQQTMTELMGKGVTVIVCPFCADHYGVKLTELIAGAKVGNPELTGGLLFKPETRTLSW